jgi:hypothetical protein
MNIFKTETVKVRSDLYKDGIGVPVGDEYICNAKEYRYRWSADDATGLQVLLNGRYQDALTIDFDFNQ